MTSVSSLFQKRMDCLNTSYLFIYELDYQVGYAFSYLESKIVLAHPNRRLMMSYCVHLPSIVRRPSKPLNDLSSEIPGSNLFLLHVEPSVKGVLQFV